MIEYDLILDEIKQIIKEGIVVEDNTIHIKNKVKYDLYNYVKKTDKKWLDKTLKEMEYRD